MPRSSCSAPEPDRGLRRASAEAAQAGQALPALLKTLLHLLFLWDLLPFPPDGFLSPWGCSPVFAVLKHLRSDQLTEGSGTEGDFLRVLAEEVWVNAFLPGTGHIGHPKLGSD